MVLIFPWFSIACGFKHSSHNATVSLFLFFQGMLIEGPQGAPGQAVSRLSRSPTLLSAFHRWRTAKGGKNVFMERASALIASEVWVWRDSQNVYLCMNVCTSVWVQEWEGKGGLGSFFFYWAHFFWNHVFTTVFVGVCVWSKGLTVVEMLVSSSLGYSMLHVCVCVCVCNLRVFLVPQDCRVPQVPMEIMVRGWVKTGFIPQ